jgi:Protein of unknown function (DUF2911)
MYERRWRKGLTIATMVVLTSAAAFAQKVVETTKGSGGSPHETVEWSVSGAKITVKYGRPFIKGRALTDVVPKDGPYRLGADEATSITSDRMLMIGELMLPAGSYSLYALPSGKEWKLIVNKQTGQSGTEYDEKQDFGRTTLKVEKAAKANEQFTIAIEDGKEGKQIAFQWADTKLTAPLMVH